MEKKKVYISFVKIVTPRGGDFYVTLKSEKINDIAELDFSKCDTKEQVLEEARKIDPDVKVIGGIILSKNEDIKIAGVYKPDGKDDISVEDVVYYLKKISEFVDNVKEEVHTKGRK